MGVLACDRNGCENIMCDILVMGTYYVCEECAEEFICQTVLPADAGDAWVNRRFTAFMGSPKQPDLDETTQRAKDFIDSYRR